MRVRRNQFSAFDHCLPLVVEKPILTWLEARYDRMSRCHCVLGCMLTRRTVTTADVPTRRTSAKMKPPTLRRCEAFHTAVAAWFRSGINSAVSLFHCVLSLGIPSLDQAQYLVSAMHRKHDLSSLVRRPGQHLVRDRSFFEREHSAHVRFQLSFIEQSRELS